MSDLFKTHLLNEGGIKKAQEVASLFDELRSGLIERCPEGREFALVQTKLEEACFFAKKAIARQPENQAPTEAVDSKARRMFAAYNAEGPNPNKTWDGKDVPPWEGLNDQVRGKWIAAAKAIVVMVVLLPALAFAQTVLTDSTTATAPSMFSKLVDQFVTPGGVGSLLALVASVIGGLSWFSSKRKAQISLAVYHAFHCAEDEGNEIEGEDVFDKAARALKVVDEYMVGHGWRPLKPGETAVAKLELSSIAGQAVAKTAIAVAAAEAQVAAANPK